jgi:hypothetical protein
MFGSIAERLLFALGIIALVVIWSLLRRNPRKSHAEMARSFLTETKINISLVETFDRQPKPRRFETVEWQLHKNGIGFLEKSVQDDLTATYTIMLGYNKRLKAAMKAKSTERVTLDLVGIKERLTRIKAGLEDWLLKNVGTIDQHERPTMFGGLFGR